MIAVLNISKLVYIRYPLQVRTRSNRSGYRIVVSLWVSVILSGVFIQVLLEKGKLQIYSGPPLLECNYYELDTSATLEYHAVFIVLVIVFTGLPIGVIVVTTILMLMLLYVRQVQGLQRQGVVTLVIVSGVYFVSYVPTVVLGCYYWEFAIASSGEPTQADVKSVVSFYKFASFAQYLNFAANPLIYFVTVKSFNGFVRQMVRRITGQDDVDPAVPLQVIR